MSEEARRSDPTPVEDQLLEVQAVELRRFRERLEARLEELRELQHHGTLLRELLRQREDDPSATQAEANRLRRELAHCSEQLACRETELLNLHETLGWRITAPLRWLSAKLGRR